jgi:tubulin-folding cofactor B
MDTVLTKPSVHDERYFSCRPNYGVFVKSEKVTIGDFPVEELNLDDDEEM